MANGRPTDKLDLRLDKGVYELEVKRRRGRHFRTVTTYLANTMDGVYGNIQNYDGDCIRNFGNGERGEYLGAGPENGAWYHPDMNAWELRVHFPVSAEQKKVLEGLVQSHNRLQEELVENRGPKRLKQSELSFGTAES